MRDQRIVDAINDRKLIRFTYHGHLRVVEPHTYGRDRKNHDAVRGYQVGGSSSSTSLPEWRVFHVAEMTGLSVTSRGFPGARPGYVRGDTAMTAIYAQL
ncbi:hypothetical protein [Quisquiliibacterium transsilvanicum]|uniref:Phosphoketolase n=1 Tax=Quisquiliibacterium transsilvanicum TaxID=1549638 RepID=A0A7W8HFW0_9BURK|nr:hypothetical protein [Quisquiliibacterium transsilvanicum]MBB5271354.1 phosphoketolase [Quisquiliibacterium transsilvanicum]